MERVDIFSVVDYDTSKLDYFKFTNVGDKVQGTFVSRDDNSIDGYKNPQTLVGLLQDDGTVKTVSIRHSKKGLLDELNKVKLGQIIGFVFTGTKDNPGKAATKFIRLIHDPKYVDEAWMKEQEKKENPTEGMTASELFPSTPATSNDVINAALGATPVVSDGDKIKEIAGLAKTKLGASSAEEVKSKIIEKTGLEFVPSNLDVILAKLKSL